MKIVFKPFLFLINITFRYPRTTLYPQRTIYPGEVTTTSQNFKDIGRTYINANYGENETDTINMCKFIGPDEKIIEASQTSSFLYPNEYISQNNIYIKYNVDIGHTKSEYADNFLTAIKDIKYYPYQLECRGLPYIEVGDYIVFSPINDDKGSSPIKVPILTRTLTGIQSLKDKYEAKGTERRYVYN